MAADPITEDRYVVDSGIGASNVKNHQR